jgi:hypothetical protein
MLDPMESLAFPGSVSDPCSTQILSRHCGAQYQTINQLIVGGHKMHIFTANIPTFHARYQRYLLITNEFAEFC